MIARGFTLVELLVSLAVLSVGLLGGSLLLLGGLRDQGLALRLQAATLLVADLADRIRASGPRLRAEDLADFAAAARAQFPTDATRATAILVPATGPASPAVFDISLRWLEPGDDRDVEIRLLVLAQSPVAG